MTGAAPGPSVPNSEPVLAVQADLRISLGGSSARLTGSGRQLVLHLDSPLDAFASVPTGSSLPLVNAVAQGLERAGLRVDVVSGRGALLSMGSGVRSRLTGFGVPQAVAFGSPTALLGLAWPGALRVVAQHRSAAGAALAAAFTAAIWAVVRSRHASHPACGADAAAGG